MEIESEEFIALFHCKDSYRELYSHIYKSNTNWLFVTLFRDCVIYLLRKLCVQQHLQIFVLFGEWTIAFTFYIPIFSNTLSNRLFIISLFHLNIISLFFLYMLKRHWTRNYPNFSFHLKKKKVKMLVSKATEIIFTRF